MGSAKKSTEVAASFSVRETLQRLAAVAARYAVLSGLLLTVAVGLFYGLWRFVRPHVVEGREFQLDPRQIVVRPTQPDWIRKDIRDEVLRGASIESQLSLLDDELAQRVYKAFALHPWIARVERVTKRHPSGLEVDVQYRRPVCMVEVPGGLYAVDIDGVLLPTADFAGAEVRQYPRLAGTLTTTESPVGTKWHDPQVQEAARIAAVLVDDWARFKLARIVPVTADGRLPQGVSNEYELQTAQGSRIRWGCPPPQGRADEPSADEKLARLRSYVEQHGTFDAASGPRQFDVRRGPSIVVTPLSADSGDSLRVLKVR